VISSYKPDIFNTKRPFTIGMELEIRLIDRKTLMPKNSSPYLLQKIPLELKTHIHKELLQSMLEIVTPVCRDSKEAVGFITKALKTLVNIGAGKDIALAALATHPLETKEDNEIVHDPRYESLARELQIVLKNFLISGLHIHIAVPDEKSAIRAYNASIKYLPLFLALSANSPFALGEDTGLYSYRNKIFERLPRAGIPQHFENYRHYCGLIDQLVLTDTIESIKDVWWDVRIHQKFGTIELRVCDAFYDPERLRAIGSLYRGLVRYASGNPVKHEYYQINKQNKWNAIRHGLNGKFIEGNRSVSIREKIHSLIDEIDRSGIFAESPDIEEINAMHRVCAKASIASKLRNIYEKNENLKSVIEEELIG